MGPLVPPLDIERNDVVDGLPYLTMPFVEGRSLRTRLSRGPLSPVDPVRVVRDVARALAVAHSRRGVLPFAVDARDGFTLFADRVDGLRDALLALEDDVATAMRELLRGHVQLDSVPATGSPTDSAMSPRS